jgi:peptide/nickel transport system permease protein
MTRLPRSDPPRGRRTELKAATRNPWISFAIRRLGRLAVSLWVLVTASFFMIHLIPGDPVRAALGKYAPQELVLAQRQALGLDDPIGTQYVHYLGNLFTGDFGTSIASSLPVSDIISQRMPATVQIALLGFAVILLTAVPLGVLMAAFTRGGRHGGVQLGFTSSTILLAAIPDFLFAVGLVYLFAIRLQWLPIAGQGDWRSYVLPVCSLAVGSAAVLTRIVRVEVLSVLGQDYVRTARAKRLRNRRIYIRHALPNALTATLTFGGLLLTGLLAGTVLIENVFVWPGLGTVIVSSIQQNDYPVVQALVLVYGLMILAVNLVVDVLLALLDPRSTIRGG